MPSPWSPGIGVIARLRCVAGRIGGRGLYLLLGSRGDSRGHEGLYPLCWRELCWRDTGGLLKGSRIINSPLIRFWALPISIWSGFCNFFGQSAI